jgi:hypothetical protein
MEKQIPNCEICKWSSLKKYYLIIVLECNAQAGKEAKTVYNNKLCQKLFKEKD